MGFLFYCRTGRPGAPGVQRSARSRSGRRGTTGRVWWWLLAAGVLQGVAGGSLRGDGPRQPTAAEGRLEPSGKFVPAVPAFIERPSGPAGPPLTNLLALAASQVTQEGEGRYRLGLVTLDARERTLSFPAEVNLREGQLEYAIVTRGGKLHESLLATDARPLHVHLAALLLGLAPTNRAAPPIPLSIEVEWKGNGPPRRAPLESLVGLAGGDPRRPVVAPLSQRTWDYSGSAILQGSLEADLEGSLVALISDPSALARLPLPPGMVARRDQRLFVPQASRMPAQGLAVTVHLRAAAAASPPAPAPRATPAPATGR